MNESKTIFFILDSFELYDFKKLYNNLDYVCCYSYIDTEYAIDNKILNIVTYDIGHLSFDLETLGYKIFIGYNGKYKHFTVGMSTTNGKELRFGHNLRKLLIAGALDNDLGIERKKFYYDMNKSTSELLAEQLTKEKLEDISSLPEYYKGKHQYDPTPEDFEIIKKLLKGFKENDGCSYYTNDFGQIFVKTNSASWKALAGREWLIDKDKMTCKLIAMN